jgi:hypothetical protein
MAGAGEGDGAAGDFDAAGEQVVRRAGEREQWACPDNSDTGLG